MEDLFADEVESSSSEDFDETQKKFIDCALNENVSIFLTGDAGAGKSYGLNYVIAELTKARKKLLITAPTGTAALLIGGQTIHSTFGLTTKSALIETTVKTMGDEKRLKLLEADTLVIDEGSMVSPKLFMMMDDIARFIRKNPKPFGGLRLIFVADFLQLPPIPNRTDEPPTYPIFTEAQKKGYNIQFCFQTPSWRDCRFKVFNLTTCHRQIDKTFINILNHIRFGIFTDEDASILRDHCMTTNSENPFNISDPINGLTKDWTSLYTKNDDVDAENERYLNTIDSPEKVFVGKGDYEFDNPQRASEKMHTILRAARDNLIKDCLAPEKLKLRVGARVMLLRNLSESLCNGSTGVVLAMDAYGYVKVKFDSREVKVLRMETWERQIGKIGKVTFSQFPLKLAYAVTVHKAQGTSLSKMMADIRHCFNEGQAYVALSRARSLEGLRVLPFNKDQIKVSQRVIDFYHNSFTLDPVFDEFVSQFSRLNVIQPIKRRMDEITEDISRPKRKFEE